LDELALRFKARRYSAVEVAILREAVLIGKDFINFVKGFVTN
jgi:hypothetical protein